MIPKLFIGDKGRARTPVRVGACLIQAARTGVRALPPLPTIIAGWAMALALPTFAAIPNLTNDWAVRLGSYSESSAAVGKDGAIYFGTWDHKLWALNPNGSRRWLFEAGLEIRSSPAVDTQGNIYFGCRDRKFYALDADGKLKWSFKTGAWIDSSPAIGADVYFGSWDGKFYALSKSGAKKWEFQTGAAIVSSPAIDAHGRICFGSHDHHFYVLDAEGKKAWDYATGGAILSSPAIGTDGTVYFTSVDGCCYALNEDGTLRWRLHTGGITETSPVIGPDDTVYVGVNKKLWAIQPDGKKKWEREATGDNWQEPIYSTPLILSDNSILLISGYNLLTDVTQDLDANWFSYLTGHTSSSPAVGAGGNVYINGSKEDGIYFFALRAKVPLAESPWPKFRGDAANTGNVSRSTK